MDFVPVEIWDLIFEYLKINDTKVFTLRKVCKTLKFLISNYVYNTRFKELKKKLVERALSIDYLSKSNRLEFVVKDTTREYLIGAIREVRVPNTITGISAKFWTYVPTKKSLEEPESQYVPFLSESREAFKNEFVSEDGCLWFDGYLFTWEKLHSSLTSALLECRPITKIGIKGISYRNSSRIQVTYNFMKDTEEYVKIFNNGTYDLCCAIEEGSIKP